jgi:hypothetical protein
VTAHKNEDFYRMREDSNYQAAAIITFWVVQTCHHFVDVIESTAENLLVAIVDDDASM